MRVTPFRVWKKGSGGVPDFSKTEIKILNTLADGKAHSIDELMECLWDEMSSRDALFTAISRIRKKLEPHGQYIRSITPTAVHPLAYVHVTKSNCSA